MTMKQVLDGANDIRTIANHPNMSNDEKVAAIKVAIEELRNDIRDLAKEHYDNYLPVEDAPVDEQQIDDVYEKLKDDDISNLKAYYSVQVFEQIPEASARSELANILIRIARNQNSTVPSTWQKIANSGGMIAKEDI